MLSKRRKAWNHVPLARAAVRFAHHDDPIRFPLASIPRAPTSPRLQSPSTSFPPGHGRPFLRSFRRALLPVSTHLSARALLLCLCAAAPSFLPGHYTLSAQEYLQIRVDTASAPFMYDEHSQYVRINLKHLSLTESTEDDNAIAQFFKVLLQGRDTEFALATLEVALHDRPVKQQVLYSLEKDGSNYDITTLAASTAVGYRLTDGFVFDESLPIGITIKRAEWEERQDVLGALVSRADGLVGGGAAGIASTVSTLFNTVTELFPPRNSRTAMSATVAPRDLTSSDLIVTSDLPSHDVDLLTLEFETMDGYFRDYSLRDGLSRAGLSDGLASWTDMVSDADRQTETHGLGPLDAILAAFSDYVAALPLTRRDRAILTACAIKEWAPNAYGGTQYDGREVRFSANRYLRLATGNLEAIRGSSCDMPDQVDCNTEECRSVADFLNKSARRNGRSAAAELYIDESMIMLLDGQEMEVTAVDYIEKFRVRRPAVFSKSSVVADQWSFTFEPGTLAMTYDGKDYQACRVIIDVSRADEDSGHRYLVTGIETTIDRDQATRGEDSHGADR